MATKNPKAGRGSCPTCSASVMFRRTATGKLTFSCDECDSSGFAHEGSAADVKWSASIAKPTPAPAPVAPAPPAPPAPAAPAAPPPAAKKKSGFTLEDV